MPLEVCRSSWATEKAIKSCQSNRVTEVDLWQKQCCGRCNLDYKPVKIPCLPHKGTLAEHFFWTSSVEMVATSKHGCNLANYTWAAVIKCKCLKDANVDKLLPWFTFFYETKCIPASLPRCMHISFLFTTNTDFVDLGYPFPTMHNTPQWVLAVDKNKVPAVIQLILQQPICATIQLLTATHSVSCYSYSPPLVLRLPDVPLRPRKSLRRLLRQKYHFKLRAGVT